MLRQCRVFDYGVILVNHANLISLGRPKRQTALGLMIHCPMVALGIESIHLIQLCLEVEWFDFREVVRRDVSPFSADVCHEKCPTVFDFTIANPVGDATKHASSFLDLFHMNVGSNTAPGSCGNVW
jgi:hypothetical protein